jgi:hypothetical protein
MALDASATDRKETGDGYGSGADMKLSRPSRDESLANFCEWFCPSLIALTWAALVSLGALRSPAPASIGVGSPTLPASGHWAEILPILVIDAQVASAGWSTK